MNKAVLERELATSRFATRGWLEMDPVETHQSLVEGLLPSQGVVPIIGTQESFKSFLAIDIAFAVATGRPWHGRAVIQGDVVYITAEDRKGHQRRRRGLAMANSCLGDNSIPFRVIEARPFLGARREGDANAIIRAVEDEGYRPRLVIIDTLNQTLEDADEDGAGMQGFMASANSIADHFGCVVVPIHHPGHSRKRRGRGGSQFGANSDNAILSERIFGPGERTYLDLTKTRNAKKGAPGLIVTLREVTLDIMDHDRHFTTLIVASVVAGEKPAKHEDAASSSQATTTADQRPRPAVTKRDTAFDALEELIEAQGVAVDGVPEGVLAIKSDVWRDLLSERIGDSEANKRAIRRARKELSEEGLIGSDGEYVWIEPDVDPDADPDA